ncbi:hypothetical protein JTB14_030783 [Gonioctena quinquepunctata]|nr:hypothetical protein JTB14_030783 [Gonioctena quinquepunctata]
MANDELVREKAHITSAREGRAMKRRKQMVEDISEEIPDEIEDVESSESQTNENDKHCQTNITAEDFTQMIISLESTKKLEARIQKVEMCYNFLKDNDIKTKYYTGLNSFNKL